MKPEKIAPGLMTALENYQQQGEKGLNLHLRSLGIINHPKTSKPHLASVFIRCEENANLNHLSKYGIQIKQSKGKIRTAFVPLEKIGRLSEESAIARITPSRYLKPLLDVAKNTIGLPNFQTKTKLTGKGVIIGIIDSGIDTTHPAFTGRILRIWDHTLPNDGNSEYPEGLELTGNLSKGILAMSRDQTGHGTHIAGIAAGNDHAFTGVAPAADLVIVKAGLNTYIADAIDYIFRVADELQRPAVVNLSLGDHYNAHDGSDPLSNFIDQESGPGKIVCCAAGNEGNADIHAETIVQQNQQVCIRFLIPASILSSPLKWRAELNGWYASSDNIEVAVQSPEGSRTHFQSIGDNGYSQKTHHISGAQVQIIMYGPENTDNGEYWFNIEITHDPNSVSIATGNTGTWRLLLNGVAVKNGKVNIWSGETTKGFDVVFTGSGVQDLMKIGSPGAAARAITVGSYTARLSWQDVDQNWQKVGLDLNTVSEFSSPGPLRNGMMKPDVVAPGAMIVSALSSASTCSPMMQVDQFHNVMAGTSMATPFITGLVALLLEKEPQLTPEEIKQRLHSSSFIPEKPVGSFDPKWGFGLIDAEKLLTLVN
ncbi:MAG: S8 family serine peptidase [Okeania sp. SIO2C2]|uniref:S8 family serine peptidase n=1 Tax=Okeania sp. SIO2C2 TaxID=2607787 RepID=UPI0013B712E0|nr:S8 family serine peptidase [Okeania sp. SIO2C2]NEP86884.1 S8 family serine peptidase [Okeania sp. SIO2C2]